MEKFIRDTTAPFNLEILAVVNPGAAANFVFKLEESYTYEIQSAYMQIVSDANAANRNLVIQVHLGTDLIFAAPATGLQVASETLYYSFALNHEPIDLSATSGWMIARMPGPIILPGGTTISSLVDSIQATDQISNIRFFVKRWPILEG